MDRSVFQLLAQAESWEERALPTFVEDAKIEDEFDAVDADCYGTHFDGEEKEELAWSPFTTSSGVAALFD
eukprot:2791288-Karenia_brevis.AAC.1